MNPIKRRQPSLAAVTCSVVALLAAGAASGAGDPAAGKEKSQTCTACHGEDGISVAPQFPILAGQYEDYLVAALRQYRSGKRRNAVMSGFATGLSDQDIADLAAWYASQDGLSVLPRRP